MAVVRAWLTRLASLLKTSYGDRALDEELGHHAELLVEKLVAEGWSPDAAALEAHRQLGSLAYAKETYREQRGLPRLEHFLTDVRQSVRGLLRAPMFAFITVLTLGLGIGATTLVFTVVYGVLVRPLPYAHPERIVQIIQLLPDPTGEPSRAGIDYDQLRNWRSSSQTLTHLGFYSSGSLTFTTEAEPVRLYGGSLSPALFEALGVLPAIGRTFRVEEELPGHERVIILSTRTWTRYFGGDPGILNRTVDISGQPYRVVGVMPPEFAFPPVNETSIGRDPSGSVDTSPEYWLPVELAPPRTAPSQGFTLRPVIGLIREGVSFEQAVAEANTLVVPMPNGKRPAVELVSFQQEIAREIRPLLLLFQGGVSFVLLIAGINVANLMLARATNRHRELAIRVALGAGSLQIARRVIAEALVLAFAGGALGWMLAFAVFPVLKSVPPDTIPRIGEIRLDTPVLVFTSLLSVLLGLSIGLFVTLRVLRAKPSQWLREITSSSSGSAGLGRNRPSTVLVVVEIAAAMVLVAGAGLLLNSFARLARVDPGFDPKPLVTFKISLPASRYAGWASQQSFSSQLVTALRSTPGVEDVALGTSLPFNPTMIGNPVIIGNQKQPGSAAFSFVSPGFFRAFGVPLRRGREFTDDDRTGSAPVVVINEAFSRKYFGSTDPIGQAMKFQSSGPLEIIGVVADTKKVRLSEDADPEISFPYQQEPSFSGGSYTLSGALRTSGDQMALVPAVRRAVSALDPLLAVYGITTMNQVLGDSYAESRLYTATATMFGAVALVLAAIGLYGLLAYSVASRTREFGIRMALGADAARVIRTVIREGLTLTSVGLAIGVLGALMVSQLLTKLLFNIQPRDPLTLAGMSALFAMVAGLACYIPARRATRISPVIALRAE